MKRYFSGLLSRFRSLRLWVIFLLLPFAVLPTIAVASAVDWHWQNTVVSFDKFRIYIKDTPGKDSNPSPVLCSRFDSTGMSYVVDIPSTHKLSEHNGKTCVISNKGKIDRLTVHYLYASNPSDCSFTITGSPKGIGHNRKLHKLTSGVRIDSGGRIPIRKNGKQGQVALSPSYEHYLEGYFHRKNFKSSTVEVPLILKPNGRKGAEAVLDLSAYPQRCRKPDTVIIQGRNLKEVQERMSKTALSNAKLIKEAEQDYTPTYPDTIDRYETTAYEMPIPKNVQWISENKEIKATFIKIELFGAQGQTGKIHFDVDGKKHHIPTELDWQGKTLTHWFLDGKKIKTECADHSCLPTDSRFRHWHEKAFKNCPASLSRKGTDIYIKISSSCKTDESAQESKIDYTESDNQLASETCLKQPVDNAVYDITLTHGDGSKNVLYCMNRKIFKDKIEAHCLAYEKKNGKITGTVIIKTGFNQAVMCQPTITIRLP